MESVKERGQENKVKGDDQMDTNIGYLDSKENNPSQPQCLNNEENKQMKEKSKKIRRPKGGKSL